VRHTIALLALLVLAGCRGPGGTYRHSGLTFDYLSGWSIVEDKPLAKGTVRFVRLGGPQHAVFTIAIYAKDARADVKDFAASVESMRGGAVESELTLGGIKFGSEKKARESGATTARIAGQDTPGIAQHFSIQLLGVAVPHEADFYQRELGARKLIFMNQVADRYAAEVRAGFQKVYDTIGFVP
jgi:hypothetical protein